MSDLPGGAEPVQPTPLQAAISGCCPRCGQGRMFAGWIKFAQTCTKCGFDFTRFNVGDGPVVFLTLGIGALITILAVTVELKFEPPFWVHILLWGPLTLVLVVGALRLGKGLLLALEYRNRATEGRLKE